MGSCSCGCPNVIISTRNFALWCSTLGQLEAGELRLRTRVLESERADRRQAVLQGATVAAIGAAGLANMVWVACCCGRMLTCSSDLLLIMQ